MTPKVAITGNLVLPGTVLNQGTVMIEGEEITGIYDPGDRFNDTEARHVDYGQAYIAPGLVDLHLHGALGMDVMDGREQSLKGIAEYQARNGVVGFLPSTLSASLETILETIRVIRNVAEDPQPSSVLGVYIEGPFISEKKKGAHPVSCIREMTEKDSEELADALTGWNVIISIAPEVGTNMRRIAKLKEAGFVVAIGHTEATYEQAMESFAKGITHATHLYNAMSGFDHREPGVVGAILDSEEISAELIADGVHVHPAALRLAVAKKGPDRICLVTDSILAAGAGDGRYIWGEKEVVVRGKKATTQDGILAGSVLTLNEAIRNMIDWTGVSLCQAVNMASLNPARVLGMDEKIGSIQVGKLANLTVMDQDFHIVDSVLKGKSVLRKGKQDDF